MSRRECSAVSLPTSAQIGMASERAILASLDVTLNLAVRTLLAEHPSLGAAETQDEPEPPHLALAASMSILAESLCELISAYLAVTERALGDAERDTDF